MTILQQVFGFEQRATRGELIHLRAFETVVAGWAIYHMWMWGQVIERIDQNMHPLGLAAFFDLDFMFHSLSPQLNVALVGLCLLWASLRGGAIPYTVALLGMHVQYVCRFSLGKVGHGSHLVGTALFGLALGAWLFRDRLLARRFGFGFTLVFTLIGYTLAAVCKLVATGPGWAAGHHLNLWITERAIDGLSAHGIESLNALQDLLLAQPILASATLLFGLVAEALALLALRRSWRPYVLGALAMMHVGIWLSMNILFIVHLSMLFVLAPPWQRWLDDGLSRSSGYSATH